jgi:opacity protein-like surface antigen
MKKFLSFVALSLALAGTAQATNCTTAADKKLQFFGDDTGIITWQDQRVDSPRDANKQRLAVSDLFQDGNDYAGAQGHCTGIEGKLLGQVKNLSFEFENETANPVHIGTGAPRYSVEIDSTGGNVTDTYGYLTAYYCQAVLPEDTRWSRADFTGRTQAGCQIFVGSETFTSDGVHSAWALLALAHPTWKMVQAYFVMDEEGTAFVDRLAFQNEMFTAPNVIQNCGSEAAC